MAYFYRGSFVQESGGSFPVPASKWLDTIEKWAVTGRIKQLERPCYSNNYIGRIYLMEVKRNEDSRE